MSTIQSTNNINGLGLTGQFTGVTTGITAANEHNRLENTQTLRRPQRIATLNRASRQSSIANTPAGPQQLPFRSGLFVSPTAPAFEAIWGESSTTAVNEHNSLRTLRRPQKIAPPNEVSHQSSMATTTAGPQQLPSKSGLFVSPTAAASKAFWGESTTAITWPEFQQHPSESELFFSPTAAASQTIWGNSSTATTADRGLENTQTLRRPQRLASPTRASMSSHPGPLQRSTGNELFDSPTATASQTIWSNSSTATTADYGLENNRTLRHPQRLATPTRASMSSQPDPLQRYTGNELFVSPTAAAFQAIWGHSSPATANEQTEITRALRRLQRIRTPISMSSRSGPLQRISGNGLFASPTAAASSAI